MDSCRKELPGKQDVRWRKDAVRQERETQALRNWFSLEGHGYYDFDFAMMDSTNNWAHVSAPGENFNSSGPAGPSSYLDSKTSPRVSFGIVTTDISEECVCVCVCVCACESLWVCMYVCQATSVMSDSAIPWTVAHQAPLSMGFSRQEWSGLPCLPPGDLPDLGTENVFYVSCIGRRVFYHSLHLGSPRVTALLPKLRRFC